MSDDAKYQKFVAKAFEAAGLPEVEEYQLETGTYTNAQIAEKMRGNPTKLLSLLMGVSNMSLVSKRTILSFAVDLAEEGEGKEVTMVGRVDYSEAVTPKDYKCAHCGATGIKLWRGYGDVPVTLLCADYAATEEKKNIDDIDADGKRTDELGQRTDQIGGCIPAVPDEEGVEYWSYTSVPDVGVNWWRSLPTKKK